MDNAVNGNTSTTGEPPPPATDYPKQHPPPSLSHDVRPGFPLSWDRPRPSPAPAPVAPAGPPRPAPATLGNTAMSRFLSLQQTTAAGGSGAPATGPLQSLPAAPSIKQTAISTSSSNNSHYPAAGDGTMMDVVVEGGDAAEHPSSVVPTAPIPLPAPVPRSNFRPPQSAGRGPEAVGGVVAAPLASAAAPPPVRAPLDIKPQLDPVLAPPPPSTGPVHTHSLTGMAGALLEMGGGGGGGAAVAEGEGGAANKKRPLESSPAPPARRNPQGQARRPHPDDDEDGEDVKSSSSDPAAVLDQRTASERARRQQGVDVPLTHRYFPGSSSLPSLNGVYELGNEEIVADLHELRTETDHEGGGLLMEERYVYHPVPDPFTRKLAARDHQQRLLAAEEDLDDDDDDDEEEDEEEDEDEEEFEEEPRKVRRQAPAAKGPANKRRTAAEQAPKERPAPAAAPSAARRRPPNLDTSHMMEVDEESDEDDDVFDSITTPLPTEFIVAEAERAQYEAAFEAIKSVMIRTYQNADQGFKRNGYAVKLIQGMCYKEAQLLAIRRRKMKMLQEVISVLKNRQWCRKDVKARIRALRKRIAEYKAEAVMDVDEEEEDDDEEEEEEKKEEEVSADKDDGDFGDLLADEEAEEEEEDGEEDSAAEGDDEEEDVCYKNEGDVLEEGDKVITPDGEGVVTAGERRGNVVVKIDSTGSLETYKAQDVQPKPPPAGAVRHNKAGVGERDVVKAWMSFENKLDKMDTISDRALKDAMASFIQEFEIDAYYDMRLSMQQRGMSPDDDYEPYYSKGRGGGGGGRSKKGGGGASGDAGSGLLPPTSFFTAPRGLVPFDTPIMVTELACQPGHFGGIFHLHPPPKPDRSDVLPRSEALVESSFASCFQGWSEDKRRLADLKADVSRLEFRVKHQKQQTEELTKWGQEAKTGLDKINTQLSVLGADLMNLRSKHEAELAIAKVPLSEAATEDLDLLVGEFSVSGLPPVSGDRGKGVVASSLDYDEELDDEAKQKKLRRLEEEAEEEAAQQEEEERKQEEEEEERRRLRRRGSRAEEVELLDVEEEDCEEEEEEEEEEEGEEGQEEEEDDDEEEEEEEGEEEEEEEEEEDEGDEGGEGGGGGGAAGRGGGAKGRQQQGGKQAADKKRGGGGGGGGAQQQTQPQAGGSGRKRPTSRGSKTTTTPRAPGAGAAAESSSDGSSPPSSRPGNTSATEGSDGQQQQQQPPTTASSSSKKGGGGAGGGGTKGGGRKGKGGS